MWLDVPGSTRQDKAHIASSHPSLAAPCLVVVQGWFSPPFTIGRTGRTLPPQHIHHIAQRSQVAAQKHTEPLVTRHHIGTVWDAPECSPAVNTVEHRGVLSQPIVSGQIAQKSARGLAVLLVLGCGWWWGWAWVSLSSVVLRCRAAPQPQSRPAPPRHAPPIRPAAAAHAWPTTTAVPARGTARAWRRQRGRRQTGRGRARAWGRPGPAPA